MNKRNRRKKGQNIVLVKYIIDKKLKYSGNRMVHDANSRELVAAIDSTIDTLYPEYRRIIENEYEKKAPKNWWTEYYSRSTFFRVKNEAVQQFLENLKW